MGTLDKYLFSCVRDVEELSVYLPLDDGEKRRISEVIARYPMCIPPYYLGLINKENLNDPIRRICLPGLWEISDSGVEDTSGEGSNTVIRGMQHKYKQTALILTTNQCSMYCRFCFRKRMVGYSGEEIADNLEEMASYVAEHSEINNVLLSGGDALVNTNTAIEAYLRAFSGISTLDFIRIGTRTPVVLPMRIYEDSELLSILKSYCERKQIIIVTHFDHPHEVTEQAKRAVDALKDCGCVVRNQTVLLRGVNDHPDVLANLLNQLVSIGVMPYYVFQCRPARGAADAFQVPLYRGSFIVENAKRMMSGQAKAFRYCMSHVTGKIEILGAAGGGNMLFRYHQAKSKADHSRIFTVKVEPDQCWLDKIPAEKKAD